MVIWFYFQDVCNYTCRKNVALIFLFILSFKSFSFSIFSSETYGRDSFQFIFGGLYICTILKIKKNKKKCYMENKNSPALMNWLYGKKKKKHFNQAQAPKECYSSCFIFVVKWETIIQSFLFFIVHFSFSFMLAIKFLPQLHWSKQNEFYFTILTYYNLYSHIGYIFLNIFLLLSHVFS